jgi:hypothetical protein
MNCIKEYDIHRYVTGTQIEAVHMPNAYHHPEDQNRQHTCKGSPPKSIDLCLRVFLSFELTRCCLVSARKQLFNVRCDEQGF